jgi:hypothetical protein
MLCFHLGWIVQLLQLKSQPKQMQKQQQQQGDTPVKQLLAALGLPAGFDASRCVHLSDKIEDGVMALLFALSTQLEAASEKMTMQPLQLQNPSAAALTGTTTSSSSSSSSSKEEEAAAAEVNADSDRDASFANDQQQQQQQSSSNPVIGKQQTQPGVYIMMKPELL